MTLALRVQAAGARAAAAALLCFVPSAALRAATIRVPEDVASLSVALSAAGDFDTVLVAPGTFAGTFVLPSRVTLRGAGETTILDGDGAGAVVTCRNALAGTRLEGVRLTDGAGHVSGGGRSGGGLFVEGGAIELLDVVVDASSADLGGGVAFVGASAVWRLGRVSGNGAVVGGGIAVVGGGVELTDLHIAGNVANTGGGAAVTGGATAVLARVRFDNEAPGGDGSGLHLEGATMVLSDSRFENESAARGAGVFLGPGAFLSASYTSWVGCVAGSMGGAVYATCEGGSGSACAEGRFTHCDFIRNDAPEAAAGAADGASRIVLEASVIAGHRSGFACADPRATLTITCSAFGAPADRPSPEMCASASDTLLADPRLCDIASGDTRRCANSPLISPPACAVPFYGAEGGGCTACGPTPVWRSTWGTLKARYR